MNSYQKQLRVLLSPALRRLYARLNTPIKIQDYIDSLPINFELTGETYRSPQGTLKAKTAHCFEGAVLAASLLAYHGGVPLLMDLRAADDCEDHVIALYKRRDRWGALSKSNHALFNWRDPVYKSPRELAMSYFHEYIEYDRRRSLRSYSAPFSLRRYPLKKWMAGEDLGFMVEDLEKSRHFPIASPTTMRNLRKTSALDSKMLDLTHEPDPRPD